MKFPYVMGERSPGRTAQEYAMKRYNPDILLDWSGHFNIYLERYHSDFYQKYRSSWWLQCLFLDWPSKQSPFVIAIVDLRNGCVLAMYPTFKKAARALSEILKQPNDIKPYFSINVPPEDNYGL